MAKRLLQQKGVVFEDIAVDNAPDVRHRMAQESGARTVPQIFIGEKHVGGCNELYALESSGQLDALLER